jgi:hypothetical protein
MRLAGKKPRSLDSMLNRLSIPVLFLSVLLVSCSSNEEAKTKGGGNYDPVVATAKTAPSSVTFFDSEVFDLQLSRSIRSSHSQISVKPANEIAIDSIPPRLNAWLIAVQRRGGNVNLVAIREGKDGKKKEEFIQLLLPIALDLVGKFVVAKMDPSASKSNVTKDVLDYIQKDPLFLGVDNMLVTINYNANDKIIRDVLFRKL